MTKPRTVKSIMNGKSPGVAFRPVRFRKVEGTPFLLITYRDGVGFGQRTGECYFDPPPCDQNAMQFAVDMLCRPNVIVAGDIDHTKALRNPVVTGLLYDEDMVDISRTTVPVRGLFQHCPACPTVVFR